MKKIVENKKAKFDYKIIEIYLAGISLKGWEVKSIRENKVNLANSFCYFKNNELFISNMHINLWKGVRDEELRPRKLLLKKNELKKLKESKEKLGGTIIPLSLLWERQYVKVKIGFSKGRNKKDKRDYIRERDSKKIDNQI